MTYGFNDAFNLNQPWFATSYLAIDEGSIIDMIENYRTGLLWNLFMQNTDVQAELTKLGFTYLTDLADIRRCEYQLNLKENLTL